LIPKKFTRNDLLKVDKKEIIKELEPNHYVVNKILKSKGVGQNKRYMVSWQGYPSNVTSWIKPNKSFQKFIDEYESKT